MGIVLGDNQYGKAETRLVRVSRTGDTHELVDLNVSVALAGDLDATHLSGDNAGVLPTDSQKNTVYAFARQGIGAIEEFGLRLARHFVDSQPAIHRARVSIESYGWRRLGEHSFARAGDEARTATVTYDGSWAWVVSGLTGLVLLNSTASEFWGYVKDKYTTLPEAYDRILATQVSARWRFNWSDDEQRMPAWEESYEQVKQHMLQAFAETYSLSLQQSLYQMGTRIIDNRGEIDEVRFSLPNKHHFLVDLEPFGLKNDNEVYFAADRPYGLIEATVLRDGCEAKIPADLTNL